MTEQAASRVIVLGSGFLGVRIAAALRSQGADVHGLALRKLDLRRRETAASLERLIDAQTTLVVSAVRPPPFGSTPDGLAKNLILLQTVAHAVEACPPRSLVYLSTDGVYGWTAEDVTEATPPEPTGYYPIAAYTGERILQTAAHGRMPILILRPTACFGPGDPHNAYGPNRFVRSAVRERIVEIVGNGEELRDHLYVEDAVKLAVELILCQAVGTLNLVSGASRSFASIVEELEGVMPFEFEVKSVPRTQPVVHRTYDATRLRAATPSFRPTPFEDALRATLAEVQASS